MLHLIQNLKLKSCCLIFAFIGREKGVNIAEEYDKQSLYPMFLERYHYLHPMTKFKHQTSNENSKLDIFEQTPSTNE
jgi:hypothetical protein